MYDEKLKELLDNVANKIYSLAKIFRKYFRHKTVNLFTTYQRYDIILV